MTHRYGKYAAVFFLIKERKKKVTASYLIGASNLLEHKSCQYSENIDTLCDAIRSFLRIVHIWRIYQNYGGIHRKCLKEKVGEFKLQNAGCN